MKLYNPKLNVFDAALDRIRMLFDEFDDVIVSTSGGKDSTVIFELTMMVAAEKNRLPQKVLFLDQEAEYTKTIEYIRKVMHRADVQPIWLQIPFKIFNATSKYKEWLECWGEGQQWIRPKEPIAVTENKYGTERFAELFTAYINTEYPKDKKVCFVSGVRCEESPTRLTVLTGEATYKWITWGKKLGGKNTNKFTFYPLFDWRFQDIWKAISDNGWHYNKIYDDLYRIGTPVKEMRVSNLNHETAVQSLYRLQEIDAPLYNAMTERLAGVDSVTKFGKDDFFVNQQELPFMFQSWREYRDYLLEHLIINPKWRETMHRAFIWDDMLYGGTLGAKFKLHDKYEKVHISSIMTNDVYLTKTRNFHQRAEPYNCRLKLKETGEYQRLKEEFARKYKTPIIEEHEPTDEASN